MILLLAALVWLFAALVVVARAGARMAREEASGDAVARLAAVRETPAGVVAITLQNRTIPSKLLRLFQDASVRDILALGVIGAATLLFFWRLISGQVWMPAGGGDLAQFLYPTYHFAAESWRQGIIPLWNPYLFAGAPFVGDIQSGIFYPFNLLAFLVSKPLTFQDLEFLSVLHFLLAGTGMYAFLRWGELGIQDSTSQGGSQSPISRSEVEDPRSEAETPRTLRGNLQTRRVGRRPCLRVQ